MQYALSKIRSAARELLTREEKDETRQFQGEAMLRRMVRLGLLLDTERKLDYVLGLTTAKLMERRLQTKVPGGAPGKSSIQHVASDDERITFFKFLVYCCLQLCTEVGFVSSTFLSFQTTERRFL